LTRKNRFPCARVDPYLVVVGVNTNHFFVHLFSQLSSPSALAFCLPRVGLQAGSRAAIALVDVR